MKAQPRVSAGEDDGFLTLLGTYEWRGPDGQHFAHTQVHRFLSRVAQGAETALALACSGLDKASLRFWLASGKKKDSPYRDFRACYRRLRAEAEADLRQEIRAAGKYNPSAAHLALKLMRPDKYDRKEGQGTGEPVRAVVLRGGEEEP